MIADIVASSWAATGEAPLESGATPVIQMSPEMSGAGNTLREFLFQRVYEPASSDLQAEQAREIIRSLYGYFLERPDRVPEGYTIRGEAPYQVAMDYVSGMTDSYALQVAEAIRPSSTKGFKEMGVALSLPPVS